MRKKNLEHLEITGELERNRSRSRQRMKLTGSQSSCQRQRQDLTRLPPRDSTLDGRWTRKPFGLSRVQPIYLSIPRPS